MHYFNNEIILYNTLLPRITKALKQTNKGRKNNLYSYFLVGVCKGYKIKQEVKEQIHCNNLEDPHSSYILVNVVSIKHNASSTFNHVITTDNVQLKLIITINHIQLRLTCV